MVNNSPLLQDTHQLDEAEPLMRRCVVIFRKFREATGHPHPNMRDAVRNYCRLLIEMEVSPEEGMPKVMVASGLSREEIIKAFFG